MPFKDINKRREYLKKWMENRRRLSGIRKRTCMSEEEKIEHQRIASRKHYRAHLEQEKNRAKLYKANNKTAQRFNEKRRRARKKNALGSHTATEWEELKKQYGNRCVFCQKSEPEIKLTQDHIVPLSKGGTDFIDNIQPLCFSCNASKQAKIIERYETIYLKFPAPEKSL